MTLGAAKSLSGTPVSIITNRAGGSNGVWRADGNPAGMPNWVGAPASGVGRPALLFAGSQVFGFSNGSPRAATSINAPSGWTIAVRCIPIASGSFYGGTVVGLNNPAAAGISVRTAGHASGAGIKLTDGAGHTLASSVTPVALSEYVVVVTHIASTGATRMTVVQMDGTTTVTTGTITGGMPLNNMFQTIGCDGSIADTYFGHVSEFALYTAPLADAEHDKLAAYLHNPLRTPLTTSGTPYVWGTGDSQMAGYDATDFLAVILSTITTPVISFNGAISGQSLNADMNPNFAGRERIMLINSAKCGSQQVICVQAIVNTLQQRQNPSTVLADLTTYVQSIQAVDPACVIVAGNCTGRSGEGTNAIYANYGPDEATFNALLAANAASLGIRVADVGSTALGAIPPLTGDAYRVVDGVSPNRAVVHWNASAGQPLAAPKYRAQLPFL